MNSKINNNLPQNIINIIKPNTGSNYTAYGNSYYFKIGSRDHIHIGINGLKANQNNTITTLPENYRPNSPVASADISDKIYMHAGITILPTGTVIVASASPAAQIDICAAPLFYEPYLPPPNNRCNGITFMTSFSN